jgi:hypothetical protein
LEINPTSSGGIAILGLLGYLVCERIIAIVDVIFDEKSLGESKDELSKLGAITLEGGLQVYTDNAKALAKIINFARNENIVWVQNTVFRYGVTKPDTNRQDYEKWVLAKMDLLIEGKKIQEVFDHNVPEYELFKLLQENKGKRRILFEGYFLPRDTENLIGMTIFGYANNCREIFFGRDLKHLYFEPVFRTKNPEVVEFFEKYFGNLLRQATPLGGPHAGNETPVAVPADRQ